MDFNASSISKSHSFHFDWLLLSKVCNVWAKKYRGLCREKRLMVSKMKTGILNK